MSCTFAPAIENTIIPMEKKYIGMCFNRKILIGVVKNTFLATRNILLIKNNCASSFPTCSMTALLNTQSNSLSSTETCHPGTVQIVYLGNDYSFRSNPAHPSRDRKSVV